MNERERERLQAEALDALLADLQSGRQVVSPGDVPPDRAAFLNGLVALARANSPDAGYAGQLEARLRAVARQKAAVQPAHPRRRNTFQGVVTAVTERTHKVNRRLVFPLAGAAVLAMILLTALALLSGKEPATGPSQLAQAPTSVATSAPLVAPTHTSLPPATPTAPAPTATPTSAPTETSVPAVTVTAGPTAIVREPIVLPALAEWQQGGYGGGGMGDPLPLKRTYALGTALPEGPARMTVYVQREPEKLTAPYAAQVAGRLGVDGPVYQSLRLATSANPDAETFRGYIVVEGARQVMFEATGIARYTDRNRTPFVEGYWHEPGAMPPLAEAVQTAEAFLRAAGLLEGEYQMTAGGDTLSFYRVLDGQWSLVEPFVRVTIWSDGQIGQVVYWPQTLDVLAEYPILSAQEAWAILSAGQSEERVWQNLYRSPEIVPWGEWRHQNPTFWARSYQPGQQAHRFGVPHTWFPIEAGGAPYVTIGDLVLTGDVQPLVEYALQQYAREQWNFVHVWGEVQDAGDYQALAVAGWEPAEETYWSGTIRRQGDRGTLTTDDGREIEVPDLPADLSDGTNAYVAGGPHGDVLEWSLIQESLVSEDPPPVGLPSEVQMTVEQVDLVYLVLAPNVIPPDRYADLGYRAAQPVWRFRGHSDQGTAFEIYVQAVSEAYVDRGP